MEIKISYAGDVDNPIIIFPMLPQSINVQTGAAFQSYSIMSEGNVKIPIGEELTAFSWEGILPGEKRKNEPYVFGWRSPKVIQYYLSLFRVERSKLNLVVTDTPINHDVYLESYSIDYKGGFGDYYYKISFINAKNLYISTAETSTEEVSSALFPLISDTDNSTDETSRKITQASYKGGLGTPIQNTDVQQPVYVQRPQELKSGIYSVVSGDSLWKIAQKFYKNGAEYQKIYDANEKVIEQTAKDHNMVNSNNGHWIFPGTVLIIP